MGNEIKVTGRQHFMGKEIPIVAGGFGEDKKCISDKTIAEIHGMEVKHVRELINRNIKRFQSSIDDVDLKVVVQNDDNLYLDLGYTKMQISKAEHIYLLSERGYAKLIKIMDTDLAWEIHDKLVDEYFEMREQLRDLSNEKIINTQLEIMDKLVNRVNYIDSKLDVLETRLKKIDEIEKRMDVVGAFDNEWMLQKIQNATKSRVCTLTADSVNKELWSHYFHSGIYSSIKKAYHVASLKSIPVDKYEDAIEIAKTWTPSDIYLQNRLAKMEGDMKAHLLSDKKIIALLQYNERTDNGKINPFRGM